MNGCSSEASFYFSSVIQTNSLFGQSIVNPEIRRVENTRVGELEAEVKQNVNDLVELNYSAADKFYDAGVNQSQRSDHESLALGDFSTNASHVLRSSRYPMPTRLDIVGSDQTRVGARVP